MNLLNLSTDKYIHFIAGEGIAAFVFVMLGQNVLAGFLTSVVAGAVKEYYDSRGHGCVEVMDFVATAAGGAFASLLLLL